MQRHSESRFVSGAILQSSEKRCESPRQSRKARLPMQSEYPCQCHIATCLFRDNSILSNAVVYCIQYNHYAHILRGSLLLFSDNRQQLIGDLAHAAVICIYAVHLAYCLFDVAGWTLPAEILPCPLWPIHPSGAFSPAAAQTYHCGCGAH